MAFVLCPYAALKDGYVLRFQDTQDVEEGEYVLPVVADPDPPMRAIERLWGPDFEVLPDKVRAYGTPVIDESKTVLTFAQLLIGLVSEGWLIEADGDAWLAGTLPAPVLNLLNTLPLTQRFAAKARALRPSEVLRDDPLVNMLAGAQGKSQGDMDMFFATYSQV